MDVLLAPEISLTDESFYKTQSADCILGILLSLNYISIAVFDNNKKSYIAFENYKLKDVYNSYKLSGCLEQIFNADKLLNIQYGKTYILFETRKYTLVPLPLFEADNKESFFNFNHSLADNEDIQCDRLLNLNAYNLFALPNNIKCQIRDKFADVRISHCITAMIETLLINYKNRSDDNELYINIAKSHFDILLLGNETIIYTNSFEFHSPEDFIYYLLFAFQQLKINPETINTLLLGNIDKHDELFEKLYKYIRNISFITKSDKVTFSYVFDKLTYHKHFNILNLHLGKA